MRKEIRLKGYDYSSAGCYFVTICVKDKHEMLGTIVGDDAHIVPRRIELSECGNITDKYISNINCAYENVVLDKYIIMPNHVHMIIAICHAGNSGTMWASSPTAAKIPSIVRSLKTLVAKECGFSFWQRAYHDRIIRGEAEYQRIWQYIDENPTRWEEDEYCIK